MLPLTWHPTFLEFLDQTRLPCAVERVRTTDYLRVIEALRRLEIRGAPLIGVAAGYAAVLAAREFLDLSARDFSARLSTALAEIEAARPTAVNLPWAVARLHRAIADLTEPARMEERLLAEALAMHEEDRISCERIGREGAALLPDGARVLTHCNAGALATGGEGTALNVIFHAWKAGILREVFVSETRPLFQGARLTMTELMQRGIPATLLTDSSSAWLMAQGRVDAVITGADRIAANGDSANKIGTYAHALAASAHGVPLYIAAPFSTVDLEIASGRDIPIEERAASDLTRIGDQELAPPGARVFAPAFDVTPAALIHAIITDRGVLRPDYTCALAEAGRA